jgi:hypothetical protein
MIWDKMLSCGMKCYHLGRIVIIWDELLSSGANVIIWEKMLSFGANVIIWNEMLSSGIKCYHLELMVSFGTKCHHLDLMLSSVSIVIIWCYHVMLSSGMITPPFLFFLETSLTLMTSRNRPGPDESSPVIAPFGCPTEYTE